MENNKKVTSNHKSPLIFVVGPTATGKSSVALSVAKKINAPILNLDSLQIYQSVPVGTAMPSKQERSEHPHFLYDYVNEGINYTAGQFRSDAIDVLNQLSGPIVLVGGSGFYIRALEKGMYSVSDTPLEIKQRVQKLFDEKGPNACFECLQKEDIEYSKKISANDHYRVQRALELIWSEGKSMAQIQQDSELQLKKTSLKNPMLWLGVDQNRQELKSRVELRFEHMLSQGLIEEVELLLKKNLTSWTPMKSVGYVETIEYLQGQITQQQWREKVVKNTMYLAKRQRTWFKKDQRIQWLNHHHEAITLMESFLQ